MKPKSTVKPPAIRLEYTREEIEEQLQELLSREELQLYFTQQRLYKRYNDLVEILQAAQLKPGAARNEK